MSPGLRIELSEIASGQFDLSKLQQAAGDRKTTLKVARDSAGVPVALVQTSRPRLFNWLRGTDKQEREVKQVVMKALAEGDHSEAAVSRGVNRAIDRMNLKPDRIRSFAELREVLREVRSQTRVENAPKVPTLSEFLTPTAFPPGSDLDAALDPLGEDERRQWQQSMAEREWNDQMEGLTALNLVLMDRGLPSVNDLIRSDPAFKPLQRFTRPADAPDSPRTPLSPGEIATMQRALTVRLTLSIDVASLLNASEPEKLDALDRRLHEAGLPPTLTLIAESSSPELKRAYADLISLNHPDFPIQKYREANASAEPRMRFPPNGVELLQKLVDTRLSGEDPILSTRPPRVNLVALLKTAHTAPVEQREAVLQNALCAVGYPVLAEMAPGAQQHLRTALQEGPGAMQSLIRAQRVLDDLGDALSQPGAQDLPRISLREVLAPRIDLQARVAAGLARFDLALAAKGYPPLENLIQEARDGVVPFDDKRQAFIDLVAKYRQHGCLSKSDASDLQLLIQTLTYRKSSETNTRGTVDVFRLSRGPEDLARMLDRRLRGANYPTLAELRANPELRSILDEFIASAGDAPGRAIREKLQDLLNTPEIREGRRANNPALSADDLLKTIDSSNTWTNKSNHRVMTALLDKELKRTGHPDLNTMRAANPHLGALLDKYQRIGMLNFQDLQRMQAIFDLYDFSKASDEESLPAPDGLMAPSGRRDAILLHLANENLLQAGDHALGDEDALLSRLDEGGRRQAEIDAQLAGLDAHLRQHGYPCLDALELRDRTIGELIGRYRATGELDSAGFNRLQLAIDALQRKSLSYSDLSGNRALQLADLQPGDILIDISGFERNNGFHNQTVMAQAIFSHPGGESTAQAAHAYVYGGMNDAGKHLVHEVAGNISTHVFDPSARHGRIQVIRPRFKATATAVSRVAGDMTRVQEGAEFKKFYNGGDAQKSMFRRIVTRKSREPAALENSPTGGNPTTSRDRMYFCSQHVAQAVQEGMFATGLGRHAVLAYDPKLIDPKYLQGKLGASRYFATIGEIDREAARRQ